MWFEPDLLPGYAWSFPLPGGRANVGFGIVGGERVGRVQDMAGIWRDLLDRPHIRGVLGEGAEPEAPHRAWPIPARIDEAVLTGRRTLFVGDAAAASDRLTGEGIGQALLSGILAAEAIASGDGTRGEAPGVVTARYRRAVRRALVADHRMSMLLIRAVRYRRGVRAGLRLAGATDWTRRNFARWLFEDYPPPSWPRPAAGVETCSADPAVPLTGHSGCSYAVNRHLISAGYMDQIPISVAADHISGSLRASVSRLVAFLIEWPVVPPGVDLGDDSLRPPQKVDSADPALDVCDDRLLLWLR